MSWVHGREMGWIKSGLVRKETALRLGTRAFGMTRLAMGYMELNSRVWSLGMRRLRMERSNWSVTPRRRWHQRSAEETISLKMWSSTWFSVIEISRCREAFLARVSQLSKEDFQICRRHDWRIDRLDQRNDVFVATVLQELQTWQRRSGAWRESGTMKSWSGKQNWKIWAHKSTGKFPAGDCKALLCARADFWDNKSICRRCLSLMRWSSDSWVSDSFESRFS